MLLVYLMACSGDISHAKAAEGYRGPQTRFDHGDAGNHLDGWTRCSLVPALEASTRFTRANLAMGDDKTYSLCLVR